MLSSAVVTFSVAVLVLSLLTVAGPAAFHDENRWRAVQRAHVSVACVFAGSTVLVAAFARGSLAAAVLSLMLLTFVVAAATIAYGARLLARQTTHGRRFLELHADPTRRAQMLRDRAEMRRAHHAEIAQSVEQTATRKAEFRAHHGLGNGVDVIPGHPAYAAQQALHDELWKAADVISRRHAQERERFADLEP